MAAKLIVKEKENTLRELSPASAGLHFSVRQNQKEPVSRLALRELPRAGWEVKNWNKPVWGRGNVLTPPSSPVQWLPLFIAHNLFFPSSSQLPFSSSWLPSQRFLLVSSSVNISKGKSSSFLLGLTPFSMFLWVEYQNSRRQPCTKPSKVKILEYTNPNF